MGRSVETVGKNVTYFDCSGFDDEGIDWDDLITNVQHDTMKKYSSFDEPSYKWMQYPYRETRIILENKFAYVTISEYCGLGAICVVLREQYEPYGVPALAENWLNKSLAGIEKIIKGYVKPLRKLGTFSNGEAVFEKAGE